MKGCAYRAELAEACAARELAAVPSWIWDGESLPVPIESIAEEHYGVLVEIRHSLARFATQSDVHVSGVLLRAQSRILVDALEAARAPGRRRFTIAHELGHLVLHGDQTRPPFHRLAHGAAPSGDSRLGAGMLPGALAYPRGELEANQFAAAMLMPARHIRELGLDTARSAADRFSVSLPAAEKRLEYLRWRVSPASTDLDFAV